MNYEEALRSTTEPTWSGLLLTSKQEALQAIERQIAAFEGRPERSVVIENMNEGYYGYYNHSDNTHIHISPLALRTPEEAIKTVLHEGRHAYQHDCLDHNDGFPQPILEQFRNGFENYASPEENFKAYANNFTELDAEDFAEKQSQLLDMERDALLHKEYGSSEEHGIPTSEKRISEDETIGEVYNPVEKTVESNEGNPGEKYDWENQTTFPEMGRELEKTKGRSEVETLVTDLRDIPMSPQDYKQYYDYFSSEEVSRRPNDQRYSMATYLQGMGVSLAGADEIGYYESRDRFLDSDALYRTLEHDHKEDLYSGNSSAKKDLFTEASHKEGTASTPLAINVGGKQTDYDIPSYSSDELKKNEMEPDLSDSREYEIIDRVEPEMNMAPSGSREYGIADRMGLEMNMVPSVSGEHGIANRTEMEMDMAPSVSKEHGIADRMEPEMNMAPSASREYGIADRTEPEMNMAPSDLGEYGIADRTQLKMNMTPKLPDERGIADDHKGIDTHEDVESIDQKGNAQTSQDNAHDAGDEAYSANESDMQDHGLSW